MANNIEYSGADKWKQKATELLNSSGGLVDDVKVNGASVVTNKVAEIDLTGYAEAADLAEVATSGDYDDLDNKPTIPSTAGDVGAYTKTEVDGLLDDKQNSLLGGSISSGNLNDYTTAGHYYVTTAGSSSVSNLPVALAGYLEVMQPNDASGSSRLQRYTAISSNAVVGVYERNYNSGAWQSWKQIGEDVFLPLTGGNLSGDTYVVGSTPYIGSRNSSFTVDTSANNGVTSAVSSYLNIQDNASAYYARIQGEATTDGSIHARLQARNMMTSGTRRTSTIRVSVDKSGNTEFATGIGGGTATYTIATPANFRSAIGIKDTPSVVDESETVSVPSASDTTLVSASLTPGTWMISYKAQFASNANGSRRTYLASSNTSTTAQYNSRMTQAAAQTLLTEVGWTTVATITSNTTIYLRARQDSGSALSTTGYIKAVRINPA